MTPPAPSTPAPADPPPRRWVAVTVVAAWLLVLVVPPALLLTQRAEWLDSLAGGEAQENWEAFRRDMRAQSDRSGPVQRKVPRSEEPPLRVWLRDYVALAVTAWLVLGGTLGGFLGMMVAGAAGYSPSRARAVAATTTKSTSVMPSTPSSENTADDPGRSGKPG